jgi:hypothetical protein
VTTFPITSPFTDGTVVTKAQLDALKDAINALPRGFVGDSQSNTAVTLATSGGGAFASPNKVTFTLTDTRRIQIYAQAKYNPSGSTGRMSIQGAYNTGSSISLGSATLIEQPGSSGGGTVGGSTVEGTVLLPAGTYTAFAAVGRVTAGSGTDTADTWLVAVYDMGNS